MPETELWTPRSLYKFWNCRYFRNQLPDIPIVWSPKEHSGRRRHILGTTHMHGETGRPVKITLNPKFKTHFIIWAMTLLHEMVHVQQWKTPLKRAHGRKFKKRIKQLVALGVYNNLL